MKYMTKAWQRKGQLGSTFLQEEAIHAYEIEYKNVFPNPPAFMDTMSSFHDCELLSATLSEGDFVMILDHSEWGIGGSIQVVLKQASVKEKEFTSQSLTWGYHELYPSKNGYELHVLFFEFGSDALYSLIVDCDTIEINPLT